MFYGALLGGVTGQTPTKGYRITELVGVRLVTHPVIPHNTPSNAP